MSDEAIWRAPELGWRIGLQSIGRELRSFVDPFDPLQPFNRRLAWAFATQFPKAVAAAHSFIPTEGHMLKSQARFFQRMMVQQPWVTNVAEVGFNGGHSSWIFLSSRPDVTVTSFDLGDHEYVTMSKSLIDRLFPGRHQLVIGDSRLTLPAFSESQPKRKFDLIYIDGGHDYEVARADLNHCRLLATNRSVVIIDDLIPHKSWGAGPARAWIDAQREGLIHEDVLIEDGFPVVGTFASEIEEKGQVWALGHYLDAGV